MYDRLLTYLRIILFVWMLGILTDLRPDRPRRAPFWRGLYIAVRTAERWTDRTARAVDDVARWTHHRWRRAEDRATRASEVP